MRKAIAGAVLGLIVMSGPAEAHVKKFPSEVTIDYLPTTAGIVQGNGRVLGTRTECYVGRTVTLLDNGVFLAEMTTEMESDGVGRWRRTGPYTNGHTYRAVIEPLTFKKNARHRHRCAGDDAQLTQSSS